MKIQNLSYKELAAKAKKLGHENPFKTKKEDLIVWLQENKPAGRVGRPRVKKELDPRIFEMGKTGKYTRREIAKEIGCKYSDVYFALRDAEITPKAARKPHAEPAEV